MEKSETINTLQLGMGWLPEQAPNGLDRVYHALARHLPRQGVQVCGLVAGSPEVARGSGHTVQAFAPAAASLPRRLWAARSLTRAALHNGYAPDLIASHFALYAAPSMDLLSGDRPLVVHFHGPWASESRMEGEAGFTTRIKAAVERLVYRRGGRFIVLSEAFQRVLSRDYGVPEEQVRIVPGGVEADRFDVESSETEARHRLGWPADCPIILTVRRLVKRVGLEPLIDAMQSVRRRCPDALLLIAGTGPLASELEARVQALDLERHVRLLGFVPDEELPLAYRAANLSVVPTAALEGFGLVAVESLAAGTPVLVTPIGGLPEVVHNLSADLVLPSARPGALAAGVGDALAGALRLPGAGACRAYARAHFDWPAIAAQVRSVYEEVL